MERTNDGERPSDSFWIDGWHVQPSLNRLERGGGAAAPEGETVQVEPRIMDVLVCLASRPGQVVTRDALMETVWTGTIVGDDPLNRAVSELRKVFGDDARRPRVIETIRKSGYRLIVPVTPGAPYAAPQPEAAPGLDRVALDRGVSDRSDVAPRAEGRATRGRADRRTVAVLVVAGLVGTVLLGVLAWRTFSAAEPAPVLRPVPFTTYPGRERDPAVSHDGNRVAFAWEGAAPDRFDLYVRLLDAETPLRLTDGGRDQSPAWSPDDQAVAFVRAGDGGAPCTLYVVPAIGGPARRLTSCAAAATSRLAWSPDGTYLAYVDRPTPQAPAGLYLLSVDALTSRPLTTPPPQYQGDDYPAFSPDGQTVAFVRSSVSGVDNVYRVPVAGGTPERLTAENQRVAGLAWDGPRHLVFASDRDGTFALWRMPARGGRPTWLLTGGDAVRHPATAPAYGASGGPAARRLVYEQALLDKNVWRAGLSGADTARAPFLASTRWDLSPQFSPDGTRVAFVSNRSGSYEIWLAGPAGEPAGQHTDFGGPIVGAPRWSPDGTALAFDTRTDGNADVYVIDVEGGPPRRLTTDAADDVAPSWSHDGRWIYFSSSRSGTWEVWKLPAEGPAARDTAVRVTDGGGFAPVEAPDGRTLYFTRRNEAGLWRMPAAGGPATRVLDDLGPNDWGNYVPTADGVYFVRRPPGGTPELAFYRFATGTVEPRTALGLHVSNPGMTLSPDGRTLLFVHIDRSESDLMLAEAE